MGETQKPTRITSRSQRQRNPVSLIQHQYSEIYHPANNCLSRRRQKKKGSTRSPNKKAGKSLSSLNLSIEQSESDCNKNGNIISSPPRENIKNRKRRVPHPGGKTVSPTSQHAKRRSRGGFSKGLNQPLLHFSYRWIGNGALKTENIKWPNGESSSNASVPTYYNTIHYQALEIKVYDYDRKVKADPLIVHIGDAVLLRSSCEYFSPLPSPKKSSANNPLCSTPDCRTSSSSSTCGGSGSSRSGFIIANGEDDRDTTLDSTLESASRADVAMDALNPYVGKVVDLWEECGKDYFCKSLSTKNFDSLKPEELLRDFNRGAKESTSVVFANDERSRRMKIRVRWFFKREDITSLDGQFIGVSRKDLLSAMTPRDLLLSDDTDANEVSTILSTCRVLRRKSVASKANTKKQLNIEGDCSLAEEHVVSKRAKTSSRMNGNILSNTTTFGGVGVGEDNDASHRLPQPFFCDYNISVGFDSTCQSTVNITPYVDPDDDDRGDTDNVSSFSTSSSQIMSHSKKRTCIIINKGSESNSSDSKNNLHPTFHETNTDEKQNRILNMHSSEFGRLSNDVSVRRMTPTSQLTISVGSSKIKVGADYQAVIPLTVNRRDYAPSRSTVSQMVWKPDVISDAKLDFFLVKAQCILKIFADKHGLELTNMEHHLMTSDTRDTSNIPRFHSLSGAIDYKEFEKDSILTLLHECHYDVTTALKTLSNDPQDYLSLWNKEEQELYNNGFQKHFNSLQDIRKGIQTKNHKDVVDYHYRFKITDQFKRYRSQKRDQAWRMMQVVERRRSDEIMRKVSNWNDSPSQQSSGNSAKKSHEWSKTGGGGPNFIGHTERRRLQAKDFLCKILDELGEEKYMSIVGYLKNFQKNTVTASQLKEGFQSQLRNHPILLEQFQSFLPIIFHNL